MSGRVWIVAALLGVAHIGLSTAVAARARPVTYVFTPLVDVVPGGVPLSASEAELLAAEAKNQVDARDIQQAYARMGSTISLDDLLRGVEAVEASDTPLTDRQRTRIAAILDAARANHGAVYAVQDEILRLEADIDRQTQAVMAALPEETRSRVLAGARTGGKPRPNGGSQPGVTPRSTP